MAFDHHSEEYAKHWAEQTAEMRAQCPVAHSDAHGGYWVVTGYEEALAVALDTDTFSQGRVDGESSYFVPSTPYALIPLELDPPLQTQMRRILNPIFTDRMANEWVSYVTDVADVHIDAFIERGEADLQVELARRVTAIVNLALVGITGLEDVDAFIDAPGIMVRAERGSPEFQAAFELTQRVEKRMKAELLKRRAEPRADVLSVVAAMQFDDERADDDLLLRLVNTIVAGGNSTTTSLIAFSLQWLSEHPDARAELAADPERLEVALEEFLRLSSPALVGGRRATADVEVAGQAIQAGDMLLVSWAGANRDPAVYPDPDEAHFDRDNSRHFAFGWGRHRCLGRSFARMMALTVLRRVLERLPDYHVDVDRIERYPRVPVVNGVLTLPATFTPGKPIGAEMPSETPPLPDKVAL